MEKDRISSKLDDRIEYLNDRLGELAPGTTEFESVAKTLKELYSLRIEETKVIGDIENQREKIEVERVSNENRINAEFDYNTDRIVEERRQYKINKIFDGVEKTAKIGCAIGLGILGFIFEEHGVLRSPTRKVLAETFRPKL